MTKISFNDIKMLFFDVGNTLISIDFEWVCKELKELGIGCDAKTLQRAEAAARPDISSQVSKIKNDPSIDERLFYLLKILEKLPFEVIKGVKSIELVARYLIPILFSEGNAMRLWSYVLPGTRNALNQFQTMGFHMHVISNSDGTVENQLIRSDLRSFFGEVIDSELVKIEKPDPRIFKLALEKTNCKPQEALFIGDIFDVDIAGAKSAGMQAILIDPYSDWDGIECERIPDLPALAHRFQREKNKD